MPILKLAVDWQSLYLIQLDFFSTFSYLAQPVLNLRRQKQARTEYIRELEAISSEMTFTFSCHSLCPFFQCCSAHDLPQYSAGLGMRRSLHSAHSLNLPHSLRCESMSSMLHPAHVRTSTSLLVLPRVEGGATAVGASGSCSLTRCLHRRASFCQAAPYWKRHARSPGCSSRR